jgi:hypothetical protein
MGIPSTGMVIDSQSYLLRDLAEKYKDRVELVYPEQCVRRMFHDFARNKVVEEFLSTDCDVLWFLDSDITPSLDVLDLIAVDYDKWQVAGATYPVFMQPPGSDILEVVFTCYKKNVETGNLTLAGVPISGKEFVGGLATGCLFIKREVFSKLKKPYFEFKFDAETRNMIEGEDLGFCRKLLELGIETFVDYSLVCRHQKEIDLLDVNNYAIQYSNRSVMRYDALLQSQVKEVVEKATAKAHADGFKAGMAAAEKALTEQSAPKSRIWVPNGIIK